jgi:hypothetical protein
MKIKEAYQKLFDRNLIEHIESETSGSFQAILVALMESDCYQPAPDCYLLGDLDADCEALKQAMDGGLNDEDQVIRKVAGKNKEQIAQMLEKFAEKFEGQNLRELFNDESYSWGDSIFGNSSFRTAMLCLLRPRKEQLAFSVRDCIVGWGTDDMGLITCLTHLSERQRRELVETYATIEGGGDLYEAIKGDCSGDYETALLALVKPAPVVMAEALTTSMKGLGTSDNLLINWMSIAKDRMDEVRTAFEAINGKTLAEWIDGDCGDADYKDTLMRLANRECVKFEGLDVGMTVQAPVKKEDAVVKFNKEFNRLIKKKKANSDAEVVPTEDEMQVMGSVFMFYGKLSSCAPNLDKQGVWDLTNMVGFPPADDGEDLAATFREWDVSGTGEITWNDFVREMTTRINDPNHYEADMLPEVL